MSFTQEWAGLVANARARQSTSMQLNGAGGKGGAKGEGGGDGEWLVVTHSVLQGFASKVRKGLSDEFQKVDDTAMREMEQVPGTMKGFACDEAFKTFQETWRGQMKHLRAQYQAVAKALDNVSDKQLQNDVETEQEFKRRVKAEKAAEERRARHQKELKEQRKGLLDYLENPDKKPPLPSDTPKYPFSNQDQDKYPWLNPQQTGKPVYGPFAPTADPKS